MKLLSLSKFADYDKNNTHCVEIMRIKNVKDSHTKGAVIYANHYYGGPR